MVAIVKSNLVNTDLHYQIVAMKILEKDTKLGHFSWHMKKGYKRPKSVRSDSVPLSSPVRIGLKIDNTL